MEERRTHITIELRGKKLGMYLEPMDADNRGAVLRRFEPIDGSPGEAEAAGGGVPAALGAASACGRKLGSVARCHCKRTPQAHRARCQTLRTLGSAPLVLCVGSLLVSTFLEAVFP